VEKFHPFDDPYAAEFVTARQNFIRTVLEELNRNFQLSNAADIGCGVGHFSKFLHDFGFHVTGIDGREENVQECKRRYPDIAFRQGNAEDLRPEQVGTFDLVFCFGLLYHLENPFRAIRNLYGLTRQVLLVESMCAPGANPSMELLDEGKVLNQGLNYVAFYPTESCLVKMLYRAGFPFVYGFTNLPPHEEFQETPRYKQRRTMLLASRSTVTLSKVHLIRELVRPWDIWTTRYQRMLSLAGRLANGARRRLVSTSNGASRP
jgi:SAM-dependent methyltransferase